MNAWEDDCRVQTSHDRDRIHESDDNNNRARTKLYILKYIFSYTFGRFNSNFLNYFPFFSSVYHIFYQNI